MIRFALRLGNAVSVVGFVAFFASALTMVVFWVLALTGWLGWIGAVVGVLTAPAAVAFPFVHWIVDGAPTAIDFWIWGGGVFALIVVVTWIGVAHPGDERAPAQLPVPADGESPTEKSA